MQIQTNHRCTILQMKQSAQNAAQIADKCKPIIYVLIRSTVVMFGPRLSLCPVQLRLLAGDQQGSLTSQRFSIHRGDTSSYVNKRICASMQACFFAGGKASHSSGGTALLASTKALLYIVSSSLSASLSASGDGGGGDVGDRGANVTS